MNFETPIVPWIDEIQNYLKDGSRKTSELKKVLKSADFEKLSYADKAKLYQMFDPKREISDELFKRQVDLYFALLESKSSPIKIPIFSDYIDWVYSQDISKMSDRTFDVLSSRLLKTKATDLSGSVVEFMDRLPEAFDKDIDKLSNSRINTLINILNEMGIEYHQLPEECKKFVADMFRACAVKSEIADKNKTRMRQLFRVEPRLYYNFFNKAFSGTGAYETWIDEPAKKITVPHMVNYANFQDKVLANYRKPLHYDSFITYAQEMKLPKFPPYDKSSSNYTQFYLKEPREYKDYAKKMGDLFVGLVREEMSRAEKLFDEKRISANELYEFTLTNNAKSRVRLFLNPYSSKRDFASKYSELLIGLVHLDELTGQSQRDIYDPSQIQDVKAVASTTTTKKTDISSRDLERRYPQSKNTEVEGQYSLFGDRYDSSFAYEDEKSEENAPVLASREYTVDDLPELYELYNQFLKQGKENFELAEIIVGLEDKQNAMTELKTFGDTE